MKILLPFIVTSIAIIIIVLLIIFFKVANIEKVFFSTDDYPEMKILEDNWELIASEIPAFDENDPRIIMRPQDAWNNLKGQELIDKFKDNETWVKGWWKHIRWYQFPLIYHKNAIGKADQICPKTMELLKKLPFIQIAGYAILLPGTKLPIHTDETGKKSKSMASNLALKSPNAYLYVKNNNSNTFSSLKHKNGIMIIFDSNREHSAENKDEDIRTILYVDFKTDTIIGTRIKGYGLANKLHYPTVNLKLNRKLECGAYICESDYGNVIVFIDSSGLYAECHFKSYDKNLDQQNTFYFWNTVKVNKYKNGAGILGTYMKGCK